MIFDPRGFRPALGIRAELAPTVVLLVPGRIRDQVENRVQRRALGLEL